MSHRCEVHQTNQGGSFGCPDRKARREIRTRKTVNYRWLDAGRNPTCNRSIEYSAIVQNDTIGPRGLRSTPNGAVTADPGVVRSADHYDYNRTACSHHDYNHIVNHMGYGDAIRA